MNDKRYADMHQGKFDAGQANKDDLLAQLSELESRARSLKCMDAVAEIKRREKSLRVNKLNKATYRSALEFIKNIKEKLDFASQCADLLSRLDALKNTAKSIFHIDFANEIERKKIDLITGDFTEEKYLDAVAFANMMTAKIQDSAERQSRGF